MNKKCFKCGKLKPRSDFYAHPRMGDKLLGKCKDCTRRDSKSQYHKKMRDPSWLQKERLRVRKKAALFSIRFPEKKLAAQALHSVPILSEVRHHWSYLPEHRTDVLHITVSEHHKAHRFMVYDQERMQYRTLDGVLLDSKESHETYIRQRLATESD